MLVCLQLLFDSFDDDVGYTLRAHKRLCGQQPSEKSNTHMTCAMVALLGVRRSTACNVGRSGWPKKSLLQVWYRQRSLQLHLWVSNVLQCLKSIKYWNITFWEDCDTKLWGTCDLASGNICELEVRWYCGRVALLPVESCKCIWNYCSEQNILLCLSRWYNVSGVHINTLLSALS